MSSVLSERKAVMATLASRTGIGHNGVPVYEIAQHTPEFIIGTGLLPRKRQPYGERRVRGILNELIESGLVSRRRIGTGPYYFKLTDKGWEAIR